MSKERIRDFVESTGFRVFILIVILLNSMTIGLQISRYEYLTNDVPQAMLLLEAFDFICLLIYINVINKLRASIKNTTGQKLSNSEIAEAQSRGCSGRTKPRTTIKKPARKRRVRKRSRGFVGALNHVPL